MDGSWLGTGSPDEYLESSSYLFLARFAVRPKGTLHTSLHCILVSRVCLRTCRLGRSTPCAVHNASKWKRCEFCPRPAGNQSKSHPGSNTLAEDPHTSTCTPYPCTSRRCL